MANFDFSLVKHIIKIRKEQKKKKNYHVEFSRSVYIGDDVIRTSSISVFEGTKNECESYIKTQLIDWTLAMINMPSDISRAIEARTNWQGLPMATLRLYQYKENADSYSAYSYYSTYTDNYYCDDDLLSII